MPITELIDKLDVFERVRDQIAGILAAESVSQMSLAETAEPPQDPALWDLAVYRERANPWEMYLQTEPAVFTPIINVWYDSSVFPQRQGDVVRRQQAEGTFNIDCYGFAVAEDTEDGHDPGDQGAVLEVQRAVRLVRNVLMAPDYTYLALRGTVARRWPGNVQSFQPDQGTRPVVHVAAIRFPLIVNFVETSIQIPGEQQEATYIQITEADSGQVLAELEVEAS